jgi:hypothetical protein
MLQARRSSRAIGPFRARQPTPGSSAPIDVPDFAAAVSASRPLASTTASVSVPAEVAALRRIEPGAAVTGEISLSRCGGLLSSRKSAFLASVSRRNPEIAPRMLLANHLRVRRRGAFLTEKSRFLGAAGHGRRENVHLSVGFRGDKRKSRREGGSCHVSRAGAGGPAGAAASRAGSLKRRPFHPADRPEKLFAVAPCSFSKTLTSVAAGCG